MKATDHLNIPSPLTEVSTSWTKEHGIRLSIKRDDLIHPLISGNKWRKLSGILSFYERESYDSIVTYGGAYSNHLVATAVTCAIMNIPCTGVIRGEEPKTPNGVLKLCSLYGMQLQFASRQEYRETNRTSGIIKNTLFIPEGGACEKGTVGCEDILKEINLDDVSQVFVGCGTGTTLAGMARYLDRLGLQDRILNGIQVLKGEGYIRDDINKLYGVTTAHVYDQFHCGGYAKTNDELINFIKEFSAETGVLLDPIYTGKMMLAIKKLADSKVIKLGEHIVAIHTGGLTGWLGKHDLLWKK